METRDSAQNVLVSGSASELVVGQKLAFAAASLAVGVSAFVSLLGMEKAILAIIFGVLALKNGTIRSTTRRGPARFGVILGVLQIVLVLVLLIVFHDQVIRFFDYLERFQVRGG